MKKIISLILVISLVTSMSTSAFAAEPTTKTINGLTVRTLESNVNLEKKELVEIVKVDDDIFYTYGDEKMSYCAQMMPNGKIQFSYMNLETGELFEGKTIDTSEVSGTSNFNIASATSNDYKLINKSIMDNLDSFEAKLVKETFPNIKAESSTRAVYSTIGQMKVAKFGADYTGQFKRSATKSHNGNYYDVYCRETQTTTNTTPDEMWFEKEVAVSVIIAWLVGGVFTWQAAVATLVLEVVTTIIKDGVRVTVNNFKSEKSQVTCIRTRYITVDGYSGTYYYAGHDQKWNFFKGDSSWTTDIDAYYENKHHDFEDLSSLLQTGFDFFVEQVL